MRMRALLADLVVAALAGCAGASRANEHLGGATVAGVAAGIGGLFGALWAGVGGFVGALWASLTGSEAEAVAPWQLTLGVRAVAWALLAATALLVAANRLEWLPKILRRRRERRRA